MFFFCFDRTYLKLKKIYLYDASVDIFLDFDLRFKENSSAIFQLVHLQRLENFSLSLWIRLDKPIIRLDEIELTFSLLDENGATRWSYKNLRDVGFNNRYI